MAMSHPPSDLNDTPPPDDQQQPPPPPLTPELLHKELAKVRGEAAKYRTQNRELRKLMGELTGDDPASFTAPPDLNTLRQRYDERGAELRATKLDLGIERAAHRHGVQKPAVLRAFLDAEGSLKAFDPADDQW